MKVLNIVRYLPITGIPTLVNDITLKIYSDLEKYYKIKSVFVLPISFLPKWVTWLNKSYKKRYKIINNPNYIDSKYGFKIFFFQAYLPLKFAKNIVSLVSFRLHQFYMFKSYLFKIYKNYNPDIIHAHTLEDGIYAYKLSKKFGIPYIITLRGHNFKMYKKNMAKKILKSSKHIVTPSYQLFKALKKEYNIELLPHGLDESWYLEGEKKVDLNSLRLVSTSRLLEMKNIHIIIQSIAELKIMGYHIKYDIIGDGPYKKDLQAMVDENSLNNQVRFYGFQSQKKIKEIYSSSDIFIMLSSSETFGRAYFEAAAQGLLIIGSKNTGADGHFNNEEAYFIDPKKTELIEVLKDLDSVRLKKMIAKSRKRVYDFKNSIIVKRYSEILESSLLDKRSKERVD